MAYNTGNPVGSGDPRDLRDNSENLDEAINGTASTWVDRLGVTRKTFKAAENAADDAEAAANNAITTLIPAEVARTENAADDAITSINALDDEAQQALDDAEDSWETRFVAGQDDRADRFEADQDGREAQFVQLMVSGGYTGTGASGAIEDYAAGITVSAYKEIIRENGEFWRAAADTALPYTTTGVGMPESGAFVNAGDGVLRQDLVQPVATLNNVADMKASAMLDAGRKARTLGYYEPGDGGGNDYEIVAAGTGTDDGGSFIDLAGSGLQAKGLFLDGKARLEQFGADRTGSDISTNAVKAAFASGLPLTDSGPGLFRLDDYVEVSGTDVDCKFSPETVFDGTAIPANGVLDEGGIFKFSGSEGAQSTVTADVLSHGEIRDTALNGRISVADASLFAVADVILLRSTQRFADGWGGPGNLRGELLEVSEVDTVNNFVYVADNIYFSYDSTQDASVTKINTISVNWRGARVIGDGVGAAHSGIKVEYGRNIRIDITEVNHCENLGVSCSCTYKGDIKARVKNCTSPTPLGNTGYGVIPSGGSRYINIELESYNNRHSVSGGGRYPVLNVKVKGNSVNSGIGTTDWDCHEPCFIWEFDVTATGGNGGIVVRGSDVKVKITNINTVRGAIIRAYGVGYIQKNIDVQYIKCVNTGSSPLQIGNNDTTRIESVHVEYAYLENPRTSHINVRNAKDVTFGTIKSKGGYILDGEVIGTSYNHIDVRNSETVHVDDFHSEGCLRHSLFAEDSTDVRIGSAKVFSPADTPIRLEGVEGFSVESGVLNYPGISSGVRGGSSNDVRIGCDLIGDPTGTVDGYRGLDCNDTRLIGSRIVAGRHAAYVSGTSENLIAVSNDFTGVADGQKVNTGNATNFVVENNLA